MPEDLLFSRLQLSAWRQFAAVEIDFHPQLTVITGANGSGKSTILNILAKHVGPERPYHAVPIRQDDGTLSYIVGRVSSSLWHFFIRSFDWSMDKEQIGEISYSNGQSSHLRVPNSVGHSYGVEIPNQQHVFGVVIGSHRLMPTYQRLQNFAFGGVPPEHAFGRLFAEANERYQGRFSGNSLLFFIKDTLANWAAFGEGNKALKADPRQKEAYDGFIDVLRKVLPESLGFLDIEVRAPEVVLLTKTGNFSIDAASGGITNLIEIAALIYGCTLQPEIRGNRFVVVFDEPENHLHPELQRTLFTNLIKAFPNAQFITATHSPFIVSSLKRSSVYVLRYQHLEAREAQDQERVVAERLDHENRTGNASAILREVLGLPTTLPQWVEHELTNIVERYQSRSLNKETLVSLRAELSAAGLSDLYTEALSELAKRK